MSKLSCHGIKGVIFNWIRSWLTDRKQRVVLNGASSDWTNVISGVPQGSVLGPLLFKIFINDIDTAVDCIHCYLFKFADDTKGVRVVNSKENAFQLQNDLNKLVEWSVEWQMLFNYDKCHILHLGAKNPRCNYTLNGNDLTSVEVEKDLGVHITDTCSPSQHVNYVASKANQTLGQLLRVFTYRDRRVFVDLYKKYVRPNLEYCVQAWSPWLKQDIDVLENVQRRAVFAISGLSGSYEDRLSAIKLLSLQDRRKRGDMLETFKIVKQIDNVDPLSFFQFTSNIHRYPTRQAASVDDETLEIHPAHGLSERPCRLELRKNFFANRVGSPWNSLSFTIKDASCLNNFKKRYDSFRHSQTPS